jgi:DNA-binding GntR family transcriptional regulator
MAAERRAGGGDSFADQIRETLIQAIADRSLEPGRVYPIQALADQLGVSRTPVREALLQLQQMSLIRIERNQGVLILDRSVDDLRDVFQVRRWLEVPATRIAAAHLTDDDDRALTECFTRMVSAAEADAAADFAAIDRDFHALILERSGNDRVVAMVNGLREFLISHGHATTWRGPALREIAQQHEPILAALAARDGDRAADAMADHLDRIARETMEANAGPNGAVTA